MYSWMSCKAKQCEGFFNPIGILCKGRLSVPGRCVGQSGREGVFTPIGSLCEGRQSTPGRRAGQCDVSAAPVGEGSAPIGRRGFPRLAKNV